MKYIKIDYWKINNTMSCILDNVLNETNQVIFIDGSYFNFHRYFSLMRWWKTAHPDETIDSPIDNQLFVEKYKKTHYEHVQQIPKKLGIWKKGQLSLPPILVGKDCKREDIWRNAYIDNYKGTRKNGPEHGFNGGPIFKMVHQDNMFQTAGVKHVLKHPHLEGDDCIAISVKYLKKYHPEVDVYIITSDKDYLQLATEKIHIFDLSYNNLAEKKSSFKDANCDLFCKIVMGDVSDNIPSVLHKCGPKTALKCYENKEYFDQRMQKENAYERFEMNQRIIDFNFIPNDLVYEFMQSLEAEETQELALQY